jgi:lipopolysaccharide transport system ATP-binding protein
MDGIISVRDLGKQYRLGAQRETYHTLRDSIMRAIAAGVTRRPADGAKTFWALRHVGLEVAPGEVLGIIGRNGAGKSTLLKILSRITEPSEGEADLYGRVGCLLEVGTGFHSELTGRDNIYLSGAILGMRRDEIVRKFDDIVAFAEVDAFIDTPVKRYSSGMHMRLAFSVAAHLEPEILIIDEVLAVGDAQFQQKCLGKIGEAARQGRTILFVSHNMAAIRTLCTRALLLEAGRVAMDGEVSACVERYLANVTESGANRADLSVRHRPAGLGRVFTFENITLCAPDNRAVIPAGSAIELQLSLRVMESVNNLSLRVAVDSDEGVRVFECPSDVTGGLIGRLEPGIWSLTCRIDASALNPGRYVFALSAWSGRHPLDSLSGALPFEIDQDRSGTSAEREHVVGLVQVSASWTSPTRLGVHKPDTVS